MAPLESHRANDLGPLAATERRLLDAGLVLAGSAAALQTVVHLLNAAFLHKPQLNVNLEHNVFAWAGTVSSFAVAFVALLAAVALTRGRTPYLVLALVVGFFSLDDMVQIHERIGADAAGALGLPEWFDSVLWPAIYVPLLATAVALMLSLARHAPARPRRLIYLALVSLLVAVAAEVVSAEWSGSATAWPHQIEGAFEEAAELAAWILIAAALTVIAARDVLRDAAPTLEGDSGRPGAQSTVK